MVAQAIRLVMKPDFEPGFAAASFAYRPGRDVHRAINQLLACRGGGRPVLLEADIADFFDSISHRLLLERLGQRVRDERLLALIRQHLQAGARQGRRLLAARRGVAQGSPLSPLLSNLYLDPFDRALADGGYALIRYADDFVVCCRAREEAERARRDVQRELARLDGRLWACSANPRQPRTGGNPPDKPANQQPPAAKLPPPRQKGPTPKSGKKGPGRWTT